jgi:hypothetical protein
MDGWTWVYGCMGKKMGRSGQGIRNNRSETGEE